MLWFFNETLRLNGVKFLPSYLIILSYFCKGITQTKKDICKTVTELIVKNVKGKTEKERISEIKAREKKKRLELELKERQKNRKIEKESEL